MLSTARIAETLTPVRADEPGFLDDPV